MMASTLASGGDETPLRRYLYYSTILGVFSAIAVVQIPFSIRLFDVLMLVNLFLMFFVINLARLPVAIMLILAYLTLSGIIGILKGTDTVELVIKEILGISITLLYFHYFFRIINYNYVRAFATYVRVAYYFTVVAFPLWITYCICFGRYERLRGLTPEPASFCILVLPAYYWYASQYLRRGKHATEVVVFTSAIALSDSSMGFVSVAFGVVLLLSGRMKHLLAIPVVVGGLLGAAYATSAGFRMRLNDTLAATANRDVAGANLSTYALLSNMLVTEQVFKESPIAGNGLGSHPISHSRYLAEIPNIQPFVDAGLADFNASDAASFALRVLSEFGLIGLIGVLYFLYHFYVGENSSYKEVSNAILVCFFLKMIRQGLYFPPEQFFFAYIYVLNHRAFRVSRNMARAPKSRVLYSRDLSVDGLPPVSSVSSRG